MYTITGSRVLDVKFTGDEYNLDCTALAAGRYIVRATSLADKWIDGKNLVIQH
jgi:hypothetical protein